LKVRKLSLQPEVVLLKLKNFTVQINDLLHEF